MNDRRQADSLPRLLEPDKANPGARCSALRGLFDRPGENAGFSYLDACGGSK